MLLWSASLRRVFVLITASRAITLYDAVILQMLRDACVPHQIIITKIDRVLSNRDSYGQIVKDLAPLHELIALIRRQLHEKQLTPLADILCTSARTISVFQGEGRLGIAGVRAACLTAAGIHDRPWTRAARLRNFSEMDGIEILEDR
jgi:hypothetical protein